MDVACQLRPVLIGRFADRVEIILKRSTTSVKNSSSKGVNYFRAPASTLERCTGLAVRPRIFGRLPPFDFCKVGK